MNFSGGAVASYLVCSLRIERSEFKPWLGALSFDLGQDTLFSQCLSPPRCTNGYRELNVVVNPVMDLGVDIFPTPA